MSMAVKLRRDNGPPAIKPVRGNKLMADAGQRILLGVSPPLTKGGKSLHPAA